MSTSRQVWGLITTNCQLSLVGTPVLDHGNWSTAPVGTVPANVTSYGAFYGVGASDSATGVSGSAQYQGPDGTTFTLSFSVPYSGNNNCTLSGSGSVQNYTYNSSFTQGDVCNFTVSINYNQ